MSAAALHQLLLYGHRLLLRSRCMVPLQVHSWDLRSHRCNEIAAKAVQIYGGYGFIKEYPVERKYRDCRVFTIYEGTSQVQQMVISGNLLK